MEIDDDEDEDSSKTPNKTLCTSCRIVRILWLHDTYSKSGNTLHNTPAGVNSDCTPAMHESTRRGHRRCTLSAIPAVCLDHSLPTFVFLIIFQTPRSTVNSGCLVADSKCYWCTRENGSSCIREFRSCDCSKKWTRWISPQERLADVCVIYLNSTSLRQDLGQFFRERFCRSRILACDEFSIYDDVGLQLHNPCQSTVPEDINMNAHHPIFGLLIDASQFLDLVLQKEGNRLISFHCKKSF